MKTDLASLVADAAFLDAFWRNVERHGEDDCWPWSKSKDKKGYGSMSWNGASVRVTHVALTVAGSPRPSPERIACHRCDNPPCCNPKHLWWGTHQENSLDSVAKNRHAKVRRTHCARGHALTAENWVHVPAGRTCRECLRISRAAYYQANREDIRRRANEGAREIYRRQRYG